jgi:hypothetical protein
MRSENPCLRNLLLRRQLLGLRLLHLPDLREGRSDGGEGAGDGAPELADLEGAVEGGARWARGEGFGALILLEEDDGPTQEAAADDGERPLMEVRRHVDDDHVGVADGAVELVAVPVEHAHAARGLDQGAEGAGEHVVSGDQHHAQGGARGRGSGWAGPGTRGRARGRGRLRPVGEDRTAGPRLNAGPRRLGARGGAATCHGGVVVAAGAHRPAAPPPPLPAPSRTRIADTTRLSR